MVEALTVEIPSETERKVAVLADDQEASLGVRQLDGRVEDDLEEATEVEVVEQALTLLVLRQARQPRTILAARALSQANRRHLHATQVRS